MVIFEIFWRQNLIKIYTKTHHFKKFSRGGMPPNPPSKAHGFAMKFPNLKKKILGPPLPNPGDAPGHYKILWISLFFISLITCKPHLPTPTVEQNFWLVTESKRLVTLVGLFSTHLIIVCLTLCFFMLIMSQCLTNHCPINFKSCFNYGITNLENMRHIFVMYQFEQSKNSLFLLRISGNK